MEFWLSTQIFMDNIILQHKFHLKIGKMIFGNHLCYLDKYLIKENSVCIQIMIDLPVFSIAKVKCLCNIVSNSNPHLPRQWLLLPCKT